MKFIKELVVGFSGYLSAIRFINKHKMWPYIIGAAFFNLFAFIFVGILAWIYTGNLISWLYSFINLPSDYEQWSNALQITVGVFIRILLILVYLNLFKYIILFIFAPVLAFISEKTQNILHNEKREIKLHHVLRDIIRGMFIAVILIVLQIFSWLILLLLCFTLPFLAPFYLIIVFIIESFFYGASMVDYRNEYFGLTVKQSLKKIFHYKGIAFGNGLFLNLLILIPVLGVLFAPSMAVISAAITGNRTFN